MSVSLNLNFLQIKNLVDQLEKKEKEELAEYLDDQTLFDEWERIKEAKKDIPLTLEEITAEVEAVREERYRAGRY